MKYRRDDDTGLSTRDRERIAAGEKAATQRGVAGPLEGGSGPSEDPGPPGPPSVMYDSLGNERKPGDKIVTGSLGPIRSTDPLPGKKKGRRTMAP